MRKTLYTLSVNNYAPELTKLTFPLLKRYADKIEADFFIITERKFPDFPIPYEKFQISELSQKHRNDWNIFYDADALVHPDFFDPTELVSKGMTISHGSDFMPVRWKPDKYFRRDGRFIGKGNWCMYGSDWVAEDLWRPLDDLTFEEVEKKIIPTVSELGTVIEPAHLIDDFTISRNIARFNLHHVLIPELIAMHKINQAGLGWHQYLINIETKIILMKKNLMLWAAAGVSDDTNQAQALDQINRWFNIPDWNDFLTAVPCGDRIAKVIQSWGIEL